MTKLEAEAEEWSWKNRRDHNCYNCNGHSEYEFEVAYLAGAERMRQLCMEEILEFSIEINSESGTRIVKLGTYLADKIKSIGKEGHGE